MDLISTLVVAVTAHDGDKRMANRFWQLAHRGKYAVSELYGMEVLNIDSPNSMAVSLPLEIVVGNGKDTVREMKKRKA
jgi:hypothetical protein